MNVEDVALTIHPHPTLNEPIQEAADVALGFPTHIQNVEKTSIILKTRYHFGSVFCGFKAKMVVANDINERV